MVTCELGACRCGWPDRCQRRLRIVYNLPAKEWEIDDLDALA